MIVVLCVCVLTPNVIRPPLGRFGVLTSVSWKTDSVLWSTFACGNFALIGGIVEPMPTPRALAPPLTVMLSTRARARLRVVHAPPERRRAACAERVFSASSQPGRILPTFPRARRSACVSPRWTPSTRIGEIFATAAPLAGGEAEPVTARRAGTDEREDEGKGKRRAKRGHARQANATAQTAYGRAVSVYVRRGNLMRLYDYSASGNCYKVRLLLAQLGLPYERVPVDIFAGDTLTEEFGRLNPARSTPVLVRDGEPPLAESNAILLHLAEGTRAPADRAGSAGAGVPLAVLRAGRRDPAIAGLRFRLLTGRLAPDNRRRAADALRARRCWRCSTGTSRAATSSWTPATRWRTSRCSATCTSPGTRATPCPPRCSAWIERVEAQPGFVDDLEPYPENARPGAGRSIYDPSP